jgi:uncharacterized protein (TIGR02145 family)
MKPMSSEIPEFQRVKIGQQTWTAENISIHVDGCQCYENNPDNCKVFGPLYTHAQAMEAANNFPGWRLPTKKDVEILISFLGGQTNAGEELKVGGSSGFNALFAGFREAKNGKYYRLNQQTGFWTSTTEDEETVWKFYLMIEKRALSFHPVSKKYGDSVRLIKVV